MASVCDLLSRGRIRSGGRVRPFDGGLPLLIAGYRTFVHARPFSGLMHQARAAAFDCRGVALPPQDTTTRTRTRHALARLLAGLRRPASGAPAPPPYERRELLLELAIVAGLAAAATAVALLLPSGG